MSSHTALSAASEDRKARLAKLKSLKRKQPTDEFVAPEANERLPATSSHKENEDADGEDAPPDVTHLHLSGRNYDPETRGPKLGFEAPPTLADDKATLEQQAADLEAQVKQQAATEAAEQKGIDLFKLQPKKPNWDLKRNLEQKMDVLNVRTDNAIARLVKDRITAAQKAAQKSSSGEDVEAAGMDGATLVESLRVREQEEEEEERREKEEDEALTA
ncbi:cwf18 pre-mRNA splicing factor [Beauveria bassiana ARSEF 2860]|uniref:Cwf18 pre-mRNA splicing factor n=1 Tax=Beauveria bassiana (strain ARSEF 2860) TaxID=655819 RepID=J4KLU6_BEAB2|nr:cwf18 pre-mRNA splicing factor [Beauveria bassiana ARSEF 2860]EJP62819.1 cwf18 pre-mRNA splicing factor [Beauveria bassiana ARSEF 2860]